MMKKLKYFVFAGCIVAFSSCMKDEYVQDVDIPAKPFIDSSAQHPKNLLYQGILDKYTGEGLPGMVALVYSPVEGLWMGASGYSCIERNIPMQKGNIFYSASIGKTFCAVAVLQLVDKGVLALNDRMSDYLDPDICNKIPNGNSARIKDLLGHTSGIPNFETEEIFIADVLNDPFSLTTESLIEYEYNKGAIFNAGEGYKYSSTGYELLAMIIDTLTHEHHSKYYTSHIFQPLYLTDMYYKNETGYPNPEGLVNCYFDRLGNGKIENVSEINNYLTTIFTGSDGIMGSVYDYYRFIDALLVRRILLSQESYNEMTSWRNTYSWTDNQYGLGLQKRQTKYGSKIGHDGDAMGAAADMFYFPDNGVIIVTACNLGTFLDTELANLYNDSFQDELLDAVFE